MYTFAQWNMDACFYFLDVREQNLKERREKKEKKNLYFSLQSTLPRAAAGSQRTVPGKQLQILTSASVEGTDLRINLM